MGYYFVDGEVCHGTLTGQLHERAHLQEIFAFDGMQYGVEPVTFSILSVVSRVILHFDMFSDGCLRIPGTDIALWRSNWPLHLLWSSTRTSSTAEDTCKCSKKQSELN